MSHLYLKQGPGKISKAREKEEHFVIHACSTFTLIFLFLNDLLVQKKTVSQLYIDFNCF